MQPLHEHRAHQLDAVAHRRELGLPQRAQLRRVEHRRDDLAAVRRRVRVVRADEALQLRQHARGLVLVVGDDRQRADALAVQRERLRERARHRAAGREWRRIGARRRHPRRCRRRIPGTRCRRTAPGRARGRPRRSRSHCAAVGSTPVGLWQHACSTTIATRRQALQRGEHAVEIEPARCGVVVRIGVDREAGAFEQRAMVLPAGIADPDLRAGREAAQEIGADLEAAGAAQCLHGDRASGFRRSTVGPEAAASAPRGRSSRSRRSADSRAAPPCRSSRARRASRIRAAGPCRCRRSRRRRRGSPSSGFESALNASVTPRIGSRGASSTVASSELGSGAFMVVGRAFARGGFYRDGGSGPRSLESAEMIGARVRAFELQCR